MTLRTRMVTWLVVLVAVGLGVFGVATYALYARSQYHRLDVQIRNAVPLVTGDLYGDDDRHPGPADGGDRGPPQIAAAGTYGELLTSSGNYVNDFLYNSTATPPTIGADVAERIDHVYTSGAW